jgi:hypothetical protein
LGGWFALALFRVQLLLFAHAQDPSSLRHNLLNFPNFWFQLISTIHAILYWIKETPLTDVLRMVRLFRKVVVLTSGSGIELCLRVI